MQCHFKPYSPRWTPICHWVVPSALRCLCKQKPYLPAVWVSSCTAAGPIFKTYRMCNLMSKKPREGICHLTLEWQRPFNRSFYKSVFTYIDETLLWHLLDFSKVGRNPSTSNYFSWSSDSESLTCLHAILGLMCNVLISFAYQIRNVRIIFTFSFGI